MTLEEIANKNKEIMEDNKLLLVDLCSRLPCRTMVLIKDGGIEPLLNVNVDTFICNGQRDLPKPYLRPMSSMTRHECTQLNVLLPRYFVVTPECLACLEHINGGIINFEVLDTIIDFYNSHHLDWRGLIPKGLALEASKDMYKF